MIEPTDEMYGVFEYAGDIPEGVARLLAIIERDYHVTRRRRKPGQIDRSLPGCLCAPKGRPYRLCPVHGQATSS